nr:hypothetical protein OG546_35690 [Streptomyces antimycoticus]
MPDRPDLLAGGRSVGAALHGVKEQLGAIPDKGIGFGLLRYLDPDASVRLRRHSTPPLGFNYLGRFPTGTSKPWSLAPEHNLVLDCADPDLGIGHAVEVNALTLDQPEGPVLTGVWT